MLWPMSPSSQTYPLWLLPLHVQLCSCNHSFFFFPLAAWPMLTTGKAIRQFSACTVLGVFHFVYSLPLSAQASSVPAEIIFLKIL